MTTLPMLHLAWSTLAWLPVCCSMGVQWPAVV
eukprot:CAMPEP_0202888482 /NCGR_PEP_ID=MMETSP1391-20130828/43213_1 /ASSEMBLY_ACC=CAM_ASM_000867 /TAXON_ID=1034604 /ORGANISM="Chlamydomonas leiostraca, Strain SAG 11-49" /LENGTH=31 /DNA_ID= /DNA_START= /DNA_END= /DNA_ORIENTATION=